MMPVDYYPIDSSRHPAYHRLEEGHYEHLEGQLRSTTTVPTFVNERETYLYDYYYRNNHMQRRTDPDQEHFFISQTTDLARQAQEERSFYETMFSANNCDPGLNAHDHMEFRDYSETPYVHSAARVWQREISEARDATQNGIGYFGGSEQQATHTKAGVQDRHVRHRQAREVDFNRQFHVDAPVVGVNEMRQGWATHTLTPLADRQGYAHTDPTAFHHDNVHAGIVEF